MNRNLLAFAVLLIIIGIASSVYLVSLFGLLILIPALIPTSRAPSRPPPAPQRQQARRVSPPPVRQAEVMPYSSPPRPHPATATAAPSAVQPPQHQNYSPALFPNAILPSLSLPLGLPRGEAEVTKKTEERDELLEAGAILAILRLVLG